MCGIVGLVDRRAALGADELTAIADAMAATIVHRGPDDHGTWVDPDAGVALGFRRLSIVDLSPTGHQPMQDGSGRWTIVTNGEVYNHQELRRQLADRGVRFRGTSDTEVLVEALAAWGVDGALDRIEGMFAFAAWSTADRRLVLARDRFGEKPLYVGTFGHQVVFASELKALAAVPGLDLDVDRDVLASYLRWGYVADPHAVYRHVEKVPPGCYLVVDLDRPAVRRQRYWDAQAEMARVSAEPFTGSLDDAATEVTDRLRSSVRLRRFADVPLGAFLSGGVDSSLVVALLQAEQSRPVQTFTIGFAEADHDESAYASAVAGHLGTDHHELLVTPAEAQAVIPLLPSVYDEPFADSSAVPMLLVSQLAREHVTVALSGDGGDELFGGYDRYQWARRVWRLEGAVPAAVRAPVARALLRVPSSRWDALLGGARRVGLPVGGVRGDRVERAVELLAEPTPERVYRRLISHWKDPDSVVLGAQEVPTPFDAADRWAAPPSFEEHMMLADTLTYLPGDILTKVDRATMAVGLEGRVPMLDRSLAALAWSLPMGMRVGDGVGKPVLHTALRRLVPAELVDRPKMGFGVPLGSWLRGPLRAWAEDLLSERRLREEGVLAVASVRALWDQHLRGERDAMYYLWDVLVLQAWLASRRPST